MNKHKSQSGFAHLMIVTVILGLGLAGALGYTFYQSFANKKDTTPVVSKNDADKDAANANDNTKQATVYKTYTDSLYNATFQYPEKWTLGTLAVPSADYPHYNRFLAINNEDGDVVARLVLGVDGIGGTCMGDDGVEVLNKLTVLESTTSSVKATKPVSMILSVFSAAEGGYDASYSLTDEYNTVGDYKVCTFYSLFESSLKGPYGNYRVSFGSGFTNKSKHFASIDGAKQYIKSDEYQEIKKMLLSLTF